MLLVGWLCWDIRHNFPLFCNCRPPLRFPVMLLEKSAMIWLSLCRMGKKQKNTYHRHKYATRNKKTIPSLGHLFYLSVSPRTQGAPRWPVDKAVWLFQTLHLCCASLWVSLLCMSWSQKSRRVNINPYILILHVHSYLKSIAGAPKDWCGSQLGDLCTAPFSPGVLHLFLSPLIPKANFFFLRSPHPAPHSHTHTVLQKGRPTLALFT